MFHTNTKHLAIVTLLFSETAEPHWNLPSKTSPQYENNISDILSNKTCYPIISLTHQAVALPAPTTVTGLTEEVTLDINSLTPYFSLTHLIKCCFSQKGHDCSSVFTVSLGLGTVVGYSNSDDLFLVQLLNAKMLCVKSI